MDSLHPDSLVQVRSRIPTCFRCGKEGSTMYLLETCLYKLTCPVSTKYWVHNRQLESTHVVSLCQECKNVAV